MSNSTYARLMEEAPIHLVLKLDTSEPMEIGAFVGTFTSLASEFDRYVRERHPDLKADTQVFVKEVRSGSIEADMFPSLMALGAIVGAFDHVLIVEDFVRRWGKRITALARGKQEDQPKTKAELRDFSDAVQAIATDPDASSTLSAAVFEDGERKVKAAFQFHTPEARAARDRIEEYKQELDATTRVDHERVLMVFTRSDVDPAQTGKRSGEKVRVESISDKSLALIYASSMAEERIKYEIRQHDSIYFKGFVVDLNVEMRSGKPVAYSVTHVHDVIDLPDED